MYERILVPTDGSQGTTHVALQAIDLADRYGATVHVIHVLPGERRSVLGGLRGSAEDRRERADEVVTQVARMAEVHDVPAESAVRSGDPASEILAYADEIEADAIVAGTHGRTGVGRRVIGSVAERLVRHATCPVMTVRLPETDVTVTDEEQARDLVSEALADAGVDATVGDVSRYEQVWVTEAEGDDASYLIYLDPVTQRSSVIERD
jgi:nucleotide-binding universal stress UspA family protein